MDDESEDPKQSLISLADVVCAIVLGGVLWFAVGLIAMLIGLIVMCG